MIDTVILTIPVSHTWIQEPDKFQPSLRGVKEALERGLGSRLFATYKYNIHHSKGYYPNLTATLRWGNGYQLFLKIQFSVPKLLYGNNLDEVGNEDFEKIVDILKNKLSEMGIRIFTEQLKNALVSIVHYSKNIPLSNHYTASMIIKNLEKLDVTKKLELNHRHFKNQGHALYFDCGSYQIVIYDKLKDINKNKRQAVDKDLTNKQLELFNFIKNNKIQAEILRIEVRLIKKTKLNSIFTQMGYVANPTFKQVFNSEISQKILNIYWNFIVNEKGLFLLKFTEQDTLKQVIDYQKQGGRKLSTIETLGIAQIIDYSKVNGLRGLRETLANIYSDRNWFRQQKYFALIGKITANRTIYGYVQDIEDTLEIFKPYRIEQDLIKGEQP